MQLLGLLGFAKHKMQITFAKTQLQSTIAKHLCNITIEKQQVLTQIVEMLRGTPRAAKTKTVGKYTVPHIRGTPRDTNGIDLKNIKNPYRLLGKNNREHAGRLDGCTARSAFQKNPQTKCVLITHFLRGSS